MIRKSIIQGTTIVLVFVAVWMALSQVDFVNVFNIHKTTLNTEKRLGDMLWKSVKHSRTIISGDSIVSPIDKLISHLAEANGIDRKKIKVHVVDEDEINAFAMPDNHLVIYRGLIEACDNESELAGVLGHEIAHMEKNHVMKKLAKEIGFSVILSMAGGQSGQTVREAGKLLSSSAYDRKLETEADMAAVDYLIKANMDPEQFANLMYKMSKDEAMPSQFSWISTHPDSEERATAIVQYIKGKKIKKTAVLTSKEWDNLKAAVSH
jgi:predicted Zn-dependent protease